MKQPARLAKHQESAWELFCMKYSRIIIFALMILLLLFIGIIVAAFIDIATAHNSTVVMVESGNYYNHLQDVI